jgi:hypothetical protein
LISYSLVSSKCMMTSNFFFMKRMSWKNGETNFSWNERS